jgi:hypothetical protein
MVAALLTAAGLLAACTRAGDSSAARSFAAVPPLKVCGQVLWSSASGAFLTDASVRSRVTGILTAGDAVFIQLAPNCENGASVTFDPPGSAVIISKATAEDGKLIAIGVCTPKKGVAHIVRVDGSTSTVDLPESGVVCLVGQGETPTR